MASRPRVERSAPGWTVIISVCCLCPLTQGLLLSPAARGALVTGRTLAQGQRQALQQRQGRRSRASRGGGLQGLRAAYTIDTQEGGKSVLRIDVGGRELVFETGQIGRQADGAILMHDGETTLYTTACADSKAEDIDFTPLKVDYQERYSAAGMTSGGYNKRDGRPSEKETLVCRLMDRPLRPMIADGWTHDTQLLSWVLSYDGQRNPEPLAITCAAAALLMSPIPLLKAVAGVKVGMAPDGSFVVDPSKDQADVSDLDLTVAGTSEGILMIEGSCNFLTEEQMVEAIGLGHEAIKTICEGLDAWQEEVGKPKKLDTLRSVPEELKEALAEALTGEVDVVLSNADVKGEQKHAMSTLTKMALDRFALDDKESEEGTSAADKFHPVYVNIALKKLLASRLRHRVLTQKKRSDGRSSTEVRPITIEASFLPRTHGSVLFTRGDTQAIATTTLGGNKMEQKFEGISAEGSKRFYLQYTFPPSCVGEVGRFGAASRREVGHGNLAERALLPVIPSRAVFPYSLRVESLITESSGSSSMASVCGGCLSMMDAGVPITRPVAGVAMGLLLDEEGMAKGMSSEGSVILTDILGLEDALGTMDFKVAGDKDAITTFQLDIKCEGLTIDLMKRALAQAKDARLHILGKMGEALAEPRTMNANVPRITMMKVRPELIGRIIGPGGKVVRSIIEDFNLQDIELEDTGDVKILSDDTAKNERAERFIKNMLGDISGVRARGGAPGAAGPAAGPGRDVKFKPEVGEVYNQCVVKGVHAFGCFVEISPGVEGLVHISELDIARVRAVEGFVNVGDRLDVALIGVNDRGQLRLSRKALLVKNRAAEQAAAAEGKGKAEKEVAMASTTAPAGEKKGAAAAAE